MGLKEWSGKNQIQAVFILTVLILIVNLLFLGVQFGLTPFTSKYDKVIVNYEDTPEGLSVTEQLDYSVSSTDEFHILYRSFNDPICKENCDIKILSVDCKNSGAYFSSPSGQVEVYPGSEKTPDYSRIESNEVGCFSDDFSGAKETLTIKYLISPALISANNYKHALFNEDHFAIKSLQVKYSDWTWEKFFIQSNKPVVIEPKSKSIKSSDIFAPFFLAIFFAFLPMIVFYYLGREKEFIVPEYIHAVPNNKREPWEVDTLVNGAGTISQTGIASLLLSLYMKGVATTKKEGNKILVTVNKKPKQAPSEIESKLLSILMQKTEKETPTYNEFSFTPKKNELAGFMMDREFVKKGTGFYNNIGYILFICLSIASFFMGFVAEGIILIISYIFFIPPSVFSRFKGDYYKEYLEWISFKNMLMDYAQIQRYLKEDYRQWRLWIGYATALGAATNLLKAMKELNLITATEYSRISSAHTAAMFVGSSSGGGGGGGGGGAGGGGGGGR